MSKGDRQRKSAVAMSQVDSNWDTIFKNNKLAKEQDALEKLAKFNQENGLYDQTDNPLIKK